MSETPTNDTTTESAAPTSGTHGRLYVFSVVVLALFVGIVVLWRQPPTSFTARVEIEQTGRHSQLNDTAAITAAIQKFHDQHAAGNDHHGHSHTDHATNHADQPHLLVDVKRSPAGKSISIWCAAKTATAAESEATLLADNYLEHFSNSLELPSQCSACKTAKRATDDARQAMSSAQADLDSFTTRHADVLSNKRQDVNQPAAPVAKPPANPAWAELKDRLEVLQAARVELLTDKTEAHPQVRDLQWQVEKLEAELALISPTLGAPTPNIAGPVIEPKPAPSPAILSQLAKLQAAVAAARRQLESAQAAEKLAQQQAKTDATATASITIPAAIVATRGASASRSAVFGGGIFALFIGVLIAWKSQRHLQPAALLSALQVESLGVPVVATLATGDGPALPQPQISNPRWVTWLTFACELAVAAIAVTMLLLMLADWQLAAEMLRDPLSTFGEAVNRLW